MTQLSEHFSFEELTHTDHRNLENIPNEFETQNLYRLAAFLEQVKTLFGGAPIMVNSAFRSQALNRAVGSKDTSQHRLGCAADIRVLGVTPGAVVTAIHESDLAYDQLIKEFVTPEGGGWTHVSIPSSAKGTPRLQALVIDKQGTRLLA